MRISEKITDLVTVNLLFVLRLSTDCYHRNREDWLYQTVLRSNISNLPVIRTCISAFRENWKLGLQLGGIELLVSGICLFDLLLFGTRQLCRCRC